MGCLESKERDEFIEACRSGSEESVQAKLVKLDLQRHRQRIKYDVNTGLLLAVENNHQSIVRLLVDFFGPRILSINTMRMDMGGHNAVTQAAFSTTADLRLLTYLLVEVGADANSYMPVDGKTALHFAAAPELQTQKLALLVAQGGLPSTRDKAGVTAEEYARAAYQSTEACDYMMRQFADAVGSCSAPSASTTVSSSVQHQEQAAVKAAMSLGSWGAPTHDEEECLPVPAAVAELSTTPTMQTADSSPQSPAAGKGKGKASPGKGEGKGKGKGEGKGKGKGKGKAKGPSGSFPVIQIENRQKYEYVRKTPRKAEKSVPTLQDSLKQIAALGDTQAVIKELKRKKAKAVPIAQREQKAKPLSFDDELKARMEKRKKQIEQDGWFKTKDTAKAEAPDAKAEVNSNPRANLKPATPKPPKPPKAEAAAAADDNVPVKRKKKKPAWFTKQPCQPPAGAASANDAAVSSSDAAASSSTAAASKQLMALPAQKSKNSSTFSMEKIEDDVREAIQQANQLPDEERKAALRELRMRWHPDKNAMLKDFASEVSKIINDELAAAEEKEQFQRAESALAALCFLTDAEETHEREEYNAATEDYLALADSTVPAEGYWRSEEVGPEVSVPCESDSDDEQKPAPGAWFTGTVSAPCESTDSDDDAEKAHQDPSIILNEYKKGVDSLDNSLKKDKDAEKKKLQDRLAARKTKKRLDQGL